MFLHRLKIALAAAALLLGASAGAQQYPAKPVRIILPFDAGGIADLQVRLAAQHLDRAWNQRVIIENRPGAQGRVGTEAALKSTPDGYTLVVITGAAPAYKALYKDVRFDLLTDLAPISTYVEIEGALFVSSQLPVRNLQEFIVYAKANPGKVNFGSTGASLTISQEAFNRAAGIKTTEVLYSGSILINNALIRGEVQLGSMLVTMAKQHVDSGAIRPIAMRGIKRTPLFPDVPTLVELGYPVLRQGWQALGAPAGTPAPIIDRVAQELVRYVASPDALKMSRDTGYDLITTTPEQLREQIRTESKIWIDTATSLGIQPQ